MTATRARSSLRETLSENTSSKFFALWAPVRGKSWSGGTFDSTTEIRISGQMVVSVTSTKTSGFPLASGSPLVDEVPAYVKYDATGIVALLCRHCVTEREKRTIRATPDGLE